MTVPDAPPVEPLTLTLEEALAKLGERGYMLGAYGRKGAPEYVLRDVYSPFARGSFGHWKDAVEAVLGVPVVPRDDTAELAEALRAWQEWAAKYQASLYFGLLSEEAYEELGRLVTDSGAVLARVRSGEP